MIKIEIKPIDTGTKHLDTEKTIKIFGVKKRSETKAMHKIKKCNDFLCDKWVYRLFYFCVDGLKYVKDEYV